jgi:hypothetical protein
VGPDIGETGLSIGYYDYTDTGSTIGFAPGNTLTYDICYNGMIVNDLDGYGVKSSDETVCTAKFDNGQLTIETLKAGTCTVTITKGEESASFGFASDGYMPDLSEVVRESNLSLGNRKTANTNSARNIFRNIGETFTATVLNGSSAITSKDGYTVTLSDGNVCSYTIEDDGSLTLTALAAGDCTVTITASDGSSVEFTFNVYGSNAAVPDIGETSLSIGYYDYTDTGSTIGFAPGNTLTYDICYDGRIVNDLDGYGVESSDETVCTAKFDNGQLTIETLTDGHCTVTITKGTDSASFIFESDGYQLTDPVVVNPSNLSLGNRKTANTNNARNIFRNSGETFTATVLNGSSAITSKDGYTVTLSDTSVCSFTIEDDGSLTLTALATGKCTVTITSGTDLDKSVVFTFNVS